MVQRKHSTLSYSQHCFILISCSYNKFIERVVTMKKSKEMLSEERKFLRLCGQHHKDLVRKNIKMTVNDFKRIQCVLMALGLHSYEVYFSMKLFPEFLNIVAEEYERRSIYEKEYFSREDNIYASMDQYMIWLREFWEQMPLESQKKKYKELIEYKEEKCIYEHSNLR